MDTRKALFYMILMATATMFVKCYQNLNTQVYLIQTISGYGPFDTDREPYLEDPFPDIFYMDNYYECSKNSGNTYCTANMNLIPKEYKSKLWMEIKHHSMADSHFNRTVIHRTLCIPSSYDSYMAKKSFIETKTNGELTMYNLSAIMFSMDCKEEGSHFGVEMIVILIGASIYTGLVFLATIYDQPSNTKNAGYKWLTIFSLKSNWKILTEDRNSDFQRLKCIQGIRTYQSAIVIACHEVLSFGQLYIKNTSYVEEIFSNLVFHTGGVFIVFIIQTYFVISSWLLTNHILEIYKKNGRFLVKDGLLLLVHRVCKFWPVLLLMIFVGTPFVHNVLHGPGNFEAVNMAARTCRENWWATLFQVTNLLDPNNVCNITMWSLTLDTQFYAITITLLYITLNYKIDLKRCLIFMFIFTYMVNITTFYKEELPLLTIFNLKILKRIDILNSNIVARGYLGFWINTGSSLIGILFGYFYFWYKGNTKMTGFEKHCGPIFAVIPVIAVVIGTFDVNRVIAIFIGPLLKPLFGFGIACGIYGMSRNIIQGWAKSICENKYAVLLGNFTFSIYVLHFLVVFFKEASSTSLIEIGIGRVIVTYVADLIKSFALGMVCALAIEQTGINIKKMILPAVRKTEFFSNESQNGDRNKLD